MKKIISLLSAAAIAASMSVPVMADDAKLLAFPGAEGGGKYTTGARGGEAIEVYHVTNLNAEGEGSFADAVSQPNRIIVFDVSGIIEIPKKIKITQPNLTILGQTAPGDGITITGADVELCADNIIMRYMRVRPTDKNNGEPDGLGGRWIDNIIVDHCSVSWGVDELLTLYAGSVEKEGKEPAKNVTVQYCISSEALRMSTHIKGSHGYGGITGGEYVSFHHNLMAHNDSRNPRLDRNLKSTDIVNNVIYNWGINSIYGGEPYSYNKMEQFSTPEYTTRVNIRDNYYKFGPSTKDNGDHVRSRVFEATNDGKTMYNGEVLKGEFYIENNYVWGDEETTANNWNHNDTVKNQANINRLSEPVDMGEYAIPYQSAEEAFEDVLATVGASLPRRDSIDARVINDVRNGTGRIINQDEEVGGLTSITSEERKFEIPAEWKAENNMGDAKETDIVKDGEFAGYTWIEAYVNDWTAEQDTPTNSIIQIAGQPIADVDYVIEGNRDEGWIKGRYGEKTSGNGFWTVIDEDEKFIFSVVTYDYSCLNSEILDDYIYNDGKNLVKIEIYDGTTLLKTCKPNDKTHSIELKPGVHYIFARAYNEKGEKTDSPTSIVYVNGKGLDGEIFATKQLGEVAFDGQGTAWYDAETDTYTVAGSGNVGGEADKCDFAYGFVTGDFTVTTKIADIPKFENGALSGIMVRESLAADSDMVMLGDGWLKGGENITVVKRVNGENASVFLPLEDGSEANNSSNKYPMPSYMKMERKGDTLTVSVSNDGIDWTNNDRKPMEIDITGWEKTLYIGLATDANDALSMVPYYAQASFSEYKVEAAEETPTKTLSIEYDENGRLVNVTTGEAKADAEVWTIYMQGDRAAAIRKN